MLCPQYISERPEESAIRIQLDSGQFIRITGCGCWLRRRTWRSRPRYRREIEKFSHVVLCGIPCGQAWQFELGLNELQNRCVIADGMRNEALFAEGRDYDQRNAIPGPSEIVIKLLLIVR